MTKEKVLEAKNFAEAFLNAVDAVEVAASAEGGEYIWYRSSKIATMKRRSMDLTRALADLRRT